MNERPVLDVSHLPLAGMGSASLTWWGTLAFMLIEGTGFALVIAVYLYLASLAGQWPIDAPLPDLLPGSALTALLVASLVPNLLLSHWAKQKQLARVRIGMIVMVLLGIAPLVLRAFEFPAVHVKWDTNAYGSIVWVILGLHTTHILTDLIDTLVLACLMFTRHADNPRRYGDVEDNAMYWNFVVATWVPLYLCLYWIPRLW
ncbi:cytochrome C oxidase subunit III [Rhizobium sp. P32RR-XVIII]|uniref:cytochrome c oxidase subunit 3 n=1 Tax=Rhizobium sp. P32RR-XVIII TaxID=2726738 RepID=UPI001456C115|nr:cytochrome c oxidase subunit 3 [Rhizobium sp. P32RR-XVIII]NLS06387.1 cytochrome C oxidase subunit III [Rhizobium sp. P32RR-XVIII]